MRLLLQYTESEASFVDFMMKNEFSYFQLNCFTHMKEVSRKDLMRWPKNGKSISYHDIKGLRWQYVVRSCSSLYA